MRESNRKFLSSQSTRLTSANGAICKKKNFFQIKLLLDGSLDTRTEAKRIFAALVDHEEYDEALSRMVNATEQQQKKP